MEDQLHVVSEDRFREVLGVGLGQHLDRAVVILKNFGPRLSYDVTNVLLYAVDRGKEGEVFEILEKHWAEYLQFQHPEIRGSVTDSLGFNLVQMMFLGLYNDTLGLGSTATAT